MSTPDKKPARRILSSTLDRESILIDARRELTMPSRRLFGKQLLTLGGLSMLTGCSLTDDKSVNAFLTAVSRLNDRAQAFIFDPKQLAPTYTEAQITRHICVEGWSAIGRWGGTPFAGFLRRVGADTSAKYVGFKCADDYYESIDMPTALHPQTLLTFDYDGERLPAKYGFPMKLRMPTKLGYKNPKHIVEMFVTNTYPGGYWVDQGYNWFGGS
jgi:hypothetical protein